MDSLWIRLVGNEWVKEWPLSLFRSDYRSGLCGRALNLA
jgi:hypothetical protein